MFEAAEIGRTVAKDEYEFEVSKLRWELLDLQRALERTSFPLLIVFGGVDGAGKSETVHLLNEWMDPRWIVNRAFDEPSEDERERPRFWRYWLALPPRGRIGLFLSAWYSQPLLDRVARRLGVPEFDAALDRIAAFERTLADDGAVILKFWMHLDRKAQKKQLEALSKDPLTRWRVTRTQWKRWKQYRSVRHCRRTPDPAHQLRPRALDHCRRDGRTVSEPGRGNRDPARAVESDRTGQPDIAGQGEGPHGRREGAAHDHGHHRSRRAHRSRPLDSRRARHDPVAREGRLQGPSAEAAGSSAPAAAPGAGPGALGHPAVRGLGRGRQGGRHPTRDIRPRAAVLPGRPDRGADRRGARAPLPLAVLAAPLTRRTRDDLRSKLVRASAGGAGGQPDAGGRLGPRVRRDRGVRGAADRSRDRAREVLAAHHQGRAAAAVRGTGQVTLQELEADRRRLAKPGEVGRL